ncbi:MAG: [FeFe] hydrogenase H-cluster radical SAM maturase HydE [Eubacterium sp.]|nr:[FeFe] hydrogenase H-cluster radical SAM maturase HydE [Eubacterium sp.]
MFNSLIDKLRKNQILSYDEYLLLIKNRDKCADYLFKNASEVRESIYGNKIYIRGLIEFTNYCKNNCYYCGIRRDNKCTDRYRLSPDEIIGCADYGYELGFRTFVLQGGEDPYYTDDILCDIVRKLKENHPDCAVTLSLGERSFDSYKALKDAGADRYLLRHETSDSGHYGKLHPDDMSFQNRLDCLENLKKLGYHVGAGFMVGSPFQTEENLANELLFLKKLNPHMVGIGPFIAHKDTPFFDQPSGTAELTLFMLGLIRLTLPNILLPATTALGTIDPLGREKGIRAGANVVMPNLSPLNVRKKYMLYDNKICTGDEAAQCIECLKRRIATTGCEIEISRGDYRQSKPNC